MQTTDAIAIPSGTRVRTPSGRIATTVDGSTVVKNSETGSITATNLIRFSDDDEVCPGGEWLWDTRKLTVVREVRLVDQDGYTVPGTVQTTVPDADVDKVRDHLLNDIAPLQAAKWSDFGHDARLYRVVPD